MNQKSENNKFDIILEAEAVLDAYKKRCRVYARKSKHSQRHVLRIVLFTLAGFSSLATFVYFLLFL